MNNYPYIVKNAQGEFVKGFKTLAAAMNYAERKGLEFAFNYEYKQA